MNQLETIISLIIIILIICIYNYINKHHKKKHTTNEIKTKYIPLSEEPKNIPQSYPYEKKMLLSKAEYAFYNILKRKCDENNLLICPKVRMEDFINVTDKKNRPKYRGYIRSRHIDFMICDNKLHLLAGIELDDNTHKNAETAKTDELKNNIFTAIQLPLFRIVMSEGMYESKIDHIVNYLKPIPSRPDQQTDQSKPENYISNQQ